MDNRFLGKGRSLQLDLSQIKTYDANIRTNAEFSLVCLEPILS